MRFAAPALCCCVALLVSACGGGSGGPTAELQAAPLLLTAGLVQLDPATEDSWAHGVDTRRLGIDSLTSVYDLTTPSGRPFVFDLLTRAESNRGPARVSMAHAADGGATPFGGADSLADAGIVPGATGATRRGEWLDVSGDGFARVTIRGSITREQVIAVETSESNAARATALVRIRIGPQSPINAGAAPAGDYPGVLDERTLYSSDSWRFGLPTAAVSGDRTSVVAYEGDRSDPHAFERYELRLQLDHATGAVTGGGEPEPSPDLGHWRDHEAAALFNVLALARSGTDAVRVRISFDRGATFRQEERFDSGTGGWQRLVQVAMALDYSLAVLYWRSNPDGSSDLVLVDGRPSAFDATGSPIRFAFEPPRAVYHDPFDIQPVLMGAAWSQGGDLAIGYGFSRFTNRPDGTWSSLTQYRCAVRRFGGPWTDTLVEEERLVGKDPSVAVAGSGDTLRVLFAYESADGVRLRTSADAGRTFGPPLAVGGAGAALPTILARDQQGALRADLLYLRQADQGTELWLHHWDDFVDIASPGADYRLTRARMEGSPGNRGGPVPGGGPGALPPMEGWRITQIAWFGYDAALDGDDVVVVYDEETFDAFTILMGVPELDMRDLGGGVLAPVAGDFVPADPPPLAPGLTEPVLPPDPEDMHQLRWMRLD